MDPASLIVTALAAGAASGPENVASTAVGNAYRALKGLVTARFSGRKAAEVALAEHEANPQVWRAALEKELRDTGVSADADVIVAAQRLMALLDEPGSRSGRYQVYQRDVQGSQIGDQGSQLSVIHPQTRPRPDPGVPETGAKSPRPATPDPGWLPDAAIRRRLQYGAAGPATDPTRASGIDEPPIPGIRGRRSRRPLQDRQEAPAPDKPVLARPGSGQGNRPGSPPRSSSPEPSGPDRVILIEGCSGIQVGQDNDQYSVYRVTLSSAALGSAQSLADHLLSLDAPWSRDVFNHNARADLSNAPGWLGFTSSSIVADPAGNTLVIVRNSRGVQVGDHNLQHNEFRIRVTDVTIQARQLGITAARKDAIERLRKDPADQAAARWLAADVARAASAHLVVDMTARVTREIGDPQIEGWPGELRNLTGRQVGGFNRVRVIVDVRVSKLPSETLARAFLKRAERQHRPAVQPESPAPRPFSGTDRTRGPRPPGIPGPHLGRGGRGFR